MSADYGIDAPPVVRNLSLIGAAALVVGIVAPRIAAMPPTLASILAAWGAWAGSSMLLSALLMIWTSKVALGWKDAMRSAPRFWMFPPVRVVRGTKPDDSQSL